MDNISIININNSQYKLLNDLITKQSEEHLEQFATMLCSTQKKDDNSECLIADSLEQWVSDNLEQTETSVEPISWEWLLFNINQKNKAKDYRISTVVSVHTHPEWYGVKQPLDAFDRDTFINWTRAFRNSGIDMINGIIANDGMKFYRWNEITQSFNNVILQVEKTFIPSTLPDNYRHSYSQGSNGANGPER